MRFRIGDRELELDLLTLRVRRRPKQMQQLNQPQKDEGADEHLDEELELTL